MKHLLRVFMLLVLISCSKKQDKPAAGSATATASSSDQMVLVKQDVEMVCASKLPRPDHEQVWQYLQSRAKSAELQKLVEEMKQGNVIMRDLDDWLQRSMGKVGITDCPLLASEQMALVKRDVEMVCASTFPRPGDETIWQYLQPKSQSDELQKLVGQMKEGRVTIQELGGWLERSMGKVGITDCPSLAGMRPVKPAP